jgi:hypothetical protein
MPIEKPLPDRFPEGTKYVVEGRGRLVRRYIEYPDGARLVLPPRKAERCICAEAKKIGLRKVAGKAAAKRSTRPAKKPLRKAA